MGLQTALAQVLVDDELREALFRDPHAFQKRFALSDAEISILTSAGADGVSLAAHSIREKRLSFLKRALPATAESAADSLLQDYLRSVIPRLELETPSRVATEGRRFVNYVRASSSRPIPAHLLELAAYELMRLELALSAEASKWAERCFRGRDDTRKLLDVRTPWNDSVRLRLGGHVRVKQFSYDVVVLAEIPVSSNGVQPPAITTCVVMKKPYRRLEPETYRVGAAVCLILNACDGGRCLSDVCASIELDGFSRDELRAKVVETLRLALHNGLLLADSGIEDRA